MAIGILFSLFHNAGTNRLGFNDIRQLLAFLLFAERFSDKEGLNLTSLELPPIMSNASEINAFPLLSDAR